MDKERFQVQSIFILEGFCTQHDYRVLREKHQSRSLFLAETNQLFQIRSLFPNFLNLSLSY